MKGAVLGGWLEALEVTVRLFFAISKPFSGKNKENLVVLV